MGKSLIIKGANFASTIEPEYERIKYIGLSSKINEEEEETPVGRYISSEIEVSSDIRIAVTFETDTQSHDNISLIGSRYSTPSIAQIKLQGNNVVASFGSYGETMQENVRTISVANLWNGGEHTIDFCIDWIKIDGIGYTWDNININKGRWKSPIYLDSSSLPPERGYNTFISETKTIGSLDDIPANDCIKLKEIKIWSNYTIESSLIVDAIPVKRKDGTVCFYNKVNGRYLTRNDYSMPEYGY